jgi:hypothetical protein
MTSRLRTLAEPDHLPALDPRFIIRPDLQTDLARQLSTPIENRPTPPK